MFNKFIKNLSKLSNYYILREEKDHVIVGTKIIINEHKEFLGNVFQPRTENIDKELSVFFLVSNAPKALELDKMFMNNELPLLSIYRKKGISNKEAVSTLLNEFIINNFKY